MFVWITLRRQGRKEIVHVSRGARQKQVVERHIMVALLSIMVHGEGLLTCSTWNSICYTAAEVTR